MGSRARDSCTRNAANRSTPASSGPQTAGLDQPRRGCSISANTGPPRPRAQSSAPVKSTRGLSAGRVARGITARINPTQTTAKGRLIRKIQRHEATPSSTPPPSGPSAAATDPNAVQEPIAAPRSDSGKVATITASELGISSAPATPCRARKAIRKPIVGASAQSSEAAPKPPTPSAKTRRSPNRSPSEPPTRISEPSVSR